MTMTEQSAPAPARRRLGATDLALVAAFAAFVAVCAVLGGFPLGGSGINLTLQTFGVLLAGALLGPVRGFLAVALYLVLAAVGLPVLSGHAGGLAPFVGASAGYLFTFPVAAAVIGLAVALVARRTGSVLALGIAVVVGGVLATVVNHLGGVAGMKVYFGVDWVTAFSYDAPFWAGDLIKVALVALVAVPVHRAFPRLLARG
ncbi:biotin transporter BioY [Nocardioides bruguierae]|uniref:Biotin transporter n=1 Tax=Nocardioides bruguierae TaxID=2945102 RepID=A0A9X2D7W9_9ACTN|nr:biotin transporter BioY [Nocardioides bruguierae]MCL8026557.1 biotin transporter BioY [Nocardioides bruguierae]MCM0619709.1 biotin transporter BioY [Nocardioides bruguierae]